MKRKNLFLPLVSALLIVAAGCSKHNDPVPVVKTHFDDLVVPPDFNWSNINRTSLKVRIVDSQGNLSAEMDGQPLDMADLENNIIQRMEIVDGEVDFSLMIDFETTQVKIVSPVSGVELTAGVGAGTVSFPVSPGWKSTYLQMEDTDSDGIPNRFDQYPADPERVFTNSFPADRHAAIPYKETPSGTNYYFQIYEDLWPNKGDYDFNDIILANKLTWTYGPKSVITGGSVTTKIWAVGESRNFPHGLGMEFFNSNSAHTLLSYLPGSTIGGVSSSSSWVHDDGHSGMTNGVILFDNVFDVLNPYYNNVGTTGWGIMGVPQTITYSYTVPLASKVKYLEILTYFFNTLVPEWQIRTYGSPPTAYMDMTMFRTQDDYSANSWQWTAGGSGFTFPLKGENAFYRSGKNHPWGLEFIYSNFKVPVETTSILLAYPQFQAWAESGGTVNKSWYKYPATGKTVAVPQQ
jgi:LruC domain-containing protein